MSGFRKARAWLTAGVIPALGALLFSSVSALGVSEDSKPVRIGVLAKRGPEQCLKQWGATADYLTTKVPGHTFEVMPLDHDEIFQAARRKEVDFVLANPSLYIELEQLYGAGRIVTLKNLRLGGAYTVYAGVIFCKAERKDIEHLRDLEGETFMAVAEESFGGWQMAWRELKEYGVDPHRDFNDLQFGGTHDAVVYAVRRGEVDAGSVRTDTLERMAMEGKIRLEEFRVIHEHGGGKVHLPFLHSTRAYPEWPLAKLPDTPDELAQKVAIALMAMSPETPAAKAASCAGWVIPQNYQPVHECLKELGIGPYKDYGKVTLGVVVRRYWPWLVVAAAFLVLSSVVAGYVTQLNRRLRHALSGQKKELDERIRAEEALRKSEQLRVQAEKLASIGRLAAGVAHEINNPLTGVLTFAHLLKEKQNMDRQDQQDLDLIVNETTRASEIVRGLLDFARESPAMKEPLEVNDAIRRTMRLLGNQKAFQHVVIVEDLAENLPEVDGDVNQLQQVLLNLSLNACEAMPDGGTLLLSTSSENEKVTVKVTDNGCGIKREHLDQIFEPFFSTKPVGKGTGLGLSVTYGIVQQHGGTLEVESEEGKGTTFTIVLPSVSADSSSQKGLQADK